MNGPQVKDCYNSAKPREKGYAADSVKIPIISNYFSAFR